MLSVLDSILRLLTAEVAAIGGISLIVGAVGITTIMTMAIAGRTSEVGLFRAIGAPRSEIRNLFRVEAAILGAAGGLAGIVGVVVLVRLVSIAIPDFPMELVWAYVIAAFLVATLIGVISGLLPASRAAHMDPVDALHAERGIQSSSLIGLLACPDAAQTRLGARPYYARRHWPPAVLSPHEFEKTGMENSAHLTARHRR